MTVKFENLVYMQSNCGVVKRFGRIHTSVHQKTFYCNEIKKSLMKRVIRVHQKLQSEKQSFNLSAKLWH